jgi:hypothetical protein
MPSLITPADAFRLLLHARLSRYDRQFKFVDKITSYDWFWHWKSRGIPRSVHTFVDETLKTFCKLIREGKIRLLSRSQIPPVHIDPIDCSLGELHVFNQTLTIDAQGTSPALVHKHVFCDETDVGKIVELIRKNRSSSPEYDPALRKATDRILRNVITAVYDEADKDKNALRPNINQLPDAARPRLKELGYEASGRQIKKIGEEPQFKRRRRAPGQKLS